MNKFLLIVLLIFVQSKKFNTFQAFKILDVEIVKDSELEEIRKNEELKKIAFKYHDLFQKSDNQEEINLALEEDFPKVKQILMKTFENNKFICPLIENKNIEDAKCVFKIPEIKTEYNVLIVAFYNYDDNTLSQLGLSFGFKVLSNLQC